MESESQRQHAYLLEVWPSGTHDLQLPVPKAGGGASKRKTAPTESTVGDVEHGHVIFTDDHGCERHDCAMLDPGASAFLSGYGPFYRYMLKLKETDYDITNIKFMRCKRTFYFGGDASLECTWTCSPALMYRWQVRLCADVPAAL